MVATTVRSVAVPMFHPEESSLHPDVVSDLLSLRAKFNYQQYNISLL